MAANGGVRASRLRWLYVARWAVAVVVTVIAVVVLVRAVVVMLRPEEIDLKIANGYVSVDWIPSMPPQKVIFRLTIRAISPTGRAFLEFSDIYFRFIDNSASTNLLITEFPFSHNISVSQQMEQDLLVTATLTPPEDVPMSYVQPLFHGRSINAEIEFDGLLTHRTNGISTYARRVTYY